jgi:hypothetical protein
MQSSARRLIGAVASLAVATMAYGRPNEAHAADPFCWYDQGCMAEYCNGTNELNFCRGLGDLWGCGDPRYIYCNYASGCEQGYRLVECHWL